MTICELPGSVSQPMLKRLCKAAGKGPVAIMTHHNPDPDGLASGEALAFILKKAWNIDNSLLYTGIIARAENRAMLKHLAYNWKPLELWSDLDNYGAIALVDTQPGSGNASLPGKYFPQIVFDHHKKRTSRDNIDYADIRTGVGAVSTILFQYIEALNLKLDSRLATALFYGLKTDTRGLSRGRSKYDEFAYFKLLSSVDHDILGMVEHAKLPLIYFKSFANALNSTKIYKKATITRLGNIHQPDFPAEIADIFIRMEGNSLALCMGIYDDILNISLRTTIEYPLAGSLLEKIVHNLGMAGGHKHMAGGQISLRGKRKNKEEVENHVIKRFLKELKFSEKGLRLLG